MIKYYSVSQSGELYKTIIKTMKKNYSGLFDVVFPEDSSFSQADFLLSLFRDDVVIVDCTIPDDLAKPTVYPILVAQVNMLDHVLVVSENDLPLNIKPLRVPYVTNSKSINGKTRQNLSEWLEENLKDILHNRYRDDNPSERIMVQSVQDLLNHKSDMERIQEYSSNCEKKRIKSENRKNILISYRSQYYSEDYDGNKTLIRDRIHPNNYEEEYDLHIFEPQSLCSGDEVLTPMRRWMLVGLLDDRIRLMDEVWVYYTPDYFDSWWTIAELVAVGYFNATTGRDNPIIVRVYDPALGMLTEIDLEKELNINMNYEVNNKKVYVERMARLMANTRPDVMAPEAREDILRMKSLAGLLQNSSRFFRNIILRRIRKTVSVMSMSSMPDNMSKEEKEEVLQHIIEMYSDPQVIIDYANDEVFSNDFWYKLSYGIGRSGKYFTKPDSSQESKKNGIVNLDEFFNAPMQELIEYSENEIMGLLKNGTTINLGKHEGNTVFGKILSISTLYLWHITKMGKAGGKDGSGLEPINIFHMRILSDK